MSRGSSLRVSCQYLVHNADVASDVLLLRSRHHMYHMARLAYELPICDLGVFLGGLCNLRSMSDACLLVRLHVLQAKSRYRRSCRMCAFADDRVICLFVGWSANKQCHNADEEEHTTMCVEYLIVIIINPSTHRFFSLS